MPIDYKKYPKKWLSEIRPRIMLRANNTCECEGCDHKHMEVLWSVKHKGVTTWCKTYEQADLLPKTYESKRNKATGKVEPVPNPKEVIVVLTIAHLDHDETNHDVTDDRLMAMCQLCHLRYDSREKFNRRNGKKKQITLPF
jgi:hypothetical protein